MDYVLQISVSDINNKVSTYNDEIMNLITDKSLFNVIDKGYNLERDGIFWEDMDNIFLPRIISVCDKNTFIHEITLYTDRDVPEIDRNLKKAERVEDKFWYQEAIDKFNIYWQMDGSELGVACPMQNIWSANANNRIGVLYTKIDRHKFFQNLAASTNEKYIISITDSKGNSVYTNSKDNSVPTIADESTAVLNNRKYIYRTQHIDDNDWNVNIFLSVSLLTDGAKSIIYTTIIICVLCLFTLVLISYILSRKATQSIDTLCENLKLIQNENLDIDIHSESTDEIGYITNFVGDTITKLKDTMNTLNEKKIFEQKSKIKILQAQINPHFLYNILSTISWQALEANNDEIAETVSLLSTFYRTGLNKGNIFVSFEQELENVKAYIKLQLLMHDDSFEVIYDIDERIYAYRCINFIIQPIVENAITHGIEHLEDGSGVIEIRAVLTEERNICISISDNGPEPASGQFDEILKKNDKGYGAWNVNERMRTAYGDDYGIRFLRENGKTTVEMIFAMLEADDENAQ
jgi:two-component system sensor histidine kinase YesM